MSNDALRAEFWQGQWKGDQPPGWKYEEQEQRHVKNVEWLEQHIPLASKHLTVFVPLCGDAPIVPYVVQKGHRVVGIELVEEPYITVRQLVKTFETELQKTFTLMEHSVPSCGGKLVEYRATDDSARLFLGNAFHLAELAPEHTVHADLAYDRGSMVALLPELRPQYTSVVDLCLVRGGFLFFDIIQRRPEALSRGPPFHCPPAVMRHFYTGRPGQQPFDVEQQTEEDIQTATSGPGVARAYSEVSWQPVIVEDDFEQRGMLRQYRGLFQKP